MKASSPGSGLRRPGMLWEQGAARHARPDRSELIIRAAFARIDLVALAAALGCVSALLLCAATVVLLLKGAPPGVEVGPHLALLAHYLPGYSVSWTGCFIGIAYGFVVGAILGALIAAIWNLVHHVHLVFKVASRHFAGDL